MWSYTLPKRDSSKNSMLYFMVISCKSCRWWLASIKLFKKVKISKKTVLFYNKILDVNLKKLEFDLQTVEFSQNVCDLILLIVNMLL